MQDAPQSDNSLPQPVNILLVEDDEVDAELVARVLRREKISNPFFTATDGVEALNLLKGQTAPQQPCLVLLDINMPRMDGFQLLDAMKNDETMKNNVVFMLTTSGRDEDKRRAEKMDAKGYILKENTGALVDILRRYCHAVNKA